MTALFIFRRDLRLADNTALNEALKEHETVHTLFIFAPSQRDHDYFSEPAFQFMIESLTDLRMAFHKHNAELNFAEGKVIEVLEKAYQEVKFEALYLNLDYTPYAKKRDERIKKWCDEQEIEYKAYHDVTILPPEQTLKDDGDPYVVFTPFYRNASTKGVAAPQEGNLKNLSKTKFSFSQDLKFIADKIYAERNQNLAVKGGRTEALKLLKNLNKNYTEDRDIPHKDGTTHLSAHHKFGTISMRESHQRFSDFYGPNHTVISELFWHDFYTQVGHRFPHVYQESFTPKFKNLSWENDPEKFKAWCEGRTGFPIVDAGIRELNQTGYMHNRLRMITSSFLIKNLNISWQWGEKYFAQRLTDYDPAVNNGSWQWAASTGTDAQPFFRVFTPWRQQERFDKEALYIKQWLPEVASVPAKALLNWAECHHDYDVDYPAPIVEHKTSSEASKQKYKQAHEKSQS